MNAPRRTGRRFAASIIATALALVGALLVAHTASADPADATVSAPATVAVTEDVATAVTGVAFTDASFTGAETLAATFTVGSGSLAAATSGGVTVSGTATALVLTGTYLDLNAFILASGLTFTTAADATADVALGVAISGGGSASSTLAVTAVNDAPTIGSVPGSINVVQNTDSPITGFTFADVDAGSASVAVTLTVGSGTLAATSGSGVVVSGSGSGTLTLTGSLASLNSFIAGSAVTFRATSLTTVSLGIAIDDGGNTGTGGAKTDNASTNLVVSLPANQAPTITAAGTIPITEDTAGPVTGISFADSDAGSASVRVTLGVGSGTLAATDAGGVTVGGTSVSRTLDGSIASINAFIAAGSVTFTPAANATANVTLTIGINDQGNTGTGGAQSASDTSTITIAAVDDAPTVTAPGTFALRNDGAPTALNTGISIADVDSAGSPVALSVTSDSGQLLATNNGGVTTTGTGTTTVVLTGTVSAINSYISTGRLSFDPSTRFTWNIHIAFTVNDLGNTGTGGPLSSATSTMIASTGQNDAPTASAPGALSDDEDTWLTVSGLGVTDSDDSDAIETVTVSLGAGASIHADGTGTVSVTGSGTDAITLNGKIGDLNSFLSNSVRVLPWPDTHFVVPLTLAINDNNAGGGGAKTASASTTITVDEVNDPPAIGIPDQTVRVDQVSAISGIAIGDVDAWQPMNLSLSVSQGQLTANGVDGVDVSGSGSGSITLVGTLDALRGFLGGGGVSFRTAPGNTGAATLTGTIDDNGSSGKGGPKQATATAQIAVQGIVVPPVVTAPGAVTVRAGQAVPLNGIRVQSQNDGQLSLVVWVIAGKLSASAPGALRIGGWPTFLVITGTPAQINFWLAIGGLKWIAPKKKGAVGMLFAARTASGIWSRPVGSRGVAR